MSAKNRIPRVPAYTLHKATGQTVVYVKENGRRKSVYLGRHDSPESHRRYRQVIAAHLQDDTIGGPSSAGPAPSNELSIEELAARFVQAAQWSFPAHVAGEGTTPASPKSDVHPRPLGLLSLPTP